MTQEQFFCMGCGVEIQTEDKNKLGFAPSGALKKETIVCQRCFRLKHYNEVPDLSLEAEAFKEMLKTISQKDALLVYIVDIFDFQGSWMPGLEQFTKNNDVILVGNKMDVLPKSTNESKLMQWMRRRSREYGLNPKEVFLISAVKNIGIEDLALNIDDFRQGRDVYVIGCTNVG